jgi:TPR repeat protein
MVLGGSLLLLVLLTISGCDSGGSSTAAPTSNQVASKQVGVLPNQIESPQISSAVQDTSLNLLPAESAPANSAVQEAVKEELAGVDIAASVPLNNPHGVVVYGGYLYVADLQNNLIRKIDLSTGVMSTFAGTASLYKPGGIIIIGKSMYVGEGSRIRKIDISTGSISEFVGSMQEGYVDAIGGEARLRSITDFATDGVNLYVAEGDGDSRKIRKVEIATGKVTTLSGSGQRGGVDGAAMTASINPWGITKVGNHLYVADHDNHKIRKIDIDSGSVTTFVGGGGKGFNGSGFSDGTGTASSFYYPAGITTDGSNLYVTDQLNNRIRKVIISTGVVTTLAGGGGEGANGAGLSDGVGVAAAFNDPHGIAIDGNNLYVTDSGNNKIRKIVIATGAVTTLLKTENTAISNSPQANELQKKANLGNIEAQYQLGELYTKEAGDNVDSDMNDNLQRYKLESVRNEKLKLAFQWYLKAAKQGHAKSQYQVAKLSGSGINTFDNKESYFSWYLKAAEQGIAEAQEAVGDFYYFGSGYQNRDVQPNPNEAYKWYMKAAQQGMERAQVGVGQAYEHGQGAPKDIKEAAKWYLKAAEHGDISAQNLLGCLLATGSPNDYVQAFMWLEIVWGTAQGWDRDTVCADNAAKAMTPAQREKAKNLAREWQSKHPNIEH